MSDFQKQQRPGATPIKNPLLSASVTGLTFDDFPNKPLLLPAAPPIVHAPAPAPAPVVTLSGMVAKEPKSLVTVGSSSLDTENLDEINLNSSNESNQTIDLADSNTNNPLLKQSNQGANSDSILSQAASSFSALPSVASNVFSTFSKRITAISSRETTPIYDQCQQDSNANALVSQFDIQPTYIQQTHLDDSSQAPPNFYAAPLDGNYITSTFVPSNQQQGQDTQTNFPLPEPPKFYIPADVPPVPSTVPPTNLAGQNNFRFSSKKKLYAPIPGLSDKNLKPNTTLDPSTISAPTSYDQSYGAPPSSNYCSQLQYFPSEEQKFEEKLGSGLFSKISSLAPAGVLENITGLVQSAAGSLTQTNKTDYYQQPPPVALDQQNNYFAAPPPPPTNYFIPPSLVGQQTNTTLIPRIAEDTGAPNTQPSPFIGGDQSETSKFSTPQPGKQGTNESFVQPLTQTQIPLLSSGNLQAQINQNFQSTPEPPRPNRPPSNKNNTQLPPSEQPVAFTFFNPNQHNLIEPAVTTTTPVSLFDPTKYLPQGAINQPIDTNYKVPPPISGHTSYRLQKGTKLYKNPLSPQESAPVPTVSNQITAVNQFTTTYSSQQSFNTPESVPLFVFSAVGKQNVIPSVPLTASPPHSSLSAESISKQSTQSISTETSQTASSLFALPSPAAAESPPNKSVESVPLFASAIERFKHNDISESIPLLNPTESPKEEVLKTANETNNSFAPPLKKLKSEKFNQAGHESGEPEQTAAVESFENKYITNVPKQDTNLDIGDHKETHPIFEPIEPIFEENITKLKEDVTEDPLEDTLQNLSLSATSTQTKFVKLPPISDSFNLNNPYRKSSTQDTAKPATSVPVLANFFTPESSEGSGTLNFFAALPATEQAAGNATNFFAETVQDKEINKEQSKTTNFFAKPFESSDLTPIEPAIAVHPPISAFFPKEKIIGSFVEENVASPVGFENVTQLEPTAPELPESITVQQANTTVQHETNIQTQQPEIVNRFSNYFNKANQQPEIAKDPSTFFDSFPGQHIAQSQPQQQQQHQIEVSVATNEEQRIQFFFNNPPPKDASAVGDLNYDLVHSGLGIKNLQQRSLTPISNLAEPPSSVCSEFSELNSSAVGQKSFVEDINKSIIEESDCSTLNSSNIKHCEELQMANLLSADKTPTKAMPYKPAVKHWFFKRTLSDKNMWVPFSHYDSALLETSLLVEGEDKSNIVAVEGGRYDVNISERKKNSVYWDSPPIEVRRCSWFYKAVDSKYVPYEEQTAELLETEYKNASESAAWPKKVVLGMAEQVEFHSPTVIVHFQQQQNADAWGGTTQTTTRPRVVRRDLEDFNIEQGESQKVDHLLFMVHGIGSVCDLKLRPVEEVVEDFRTIARQLVQSHYKNSTDLGLVGRVEVLPISWHSQLHSVEMGIDEKLRMITLESIPKLRNFTNDTLLDILFYTSPTFCQKIMNTITTSMNTLYLKYRERHPEFNGGVSLAGHSLGSLILFDLLCHQKPIKETEEKNLENPDQFSTPAAANPQLDSNQLEDKQISYTMGRAGTGQPFIDYDQLIFQPKKFFALGSPIGMFVTIRGIDKLGLDFRLPTCPGFYNIFHPYDPVAYRIEALVNPDLSSVRPVLIPHHKGRKRMHLELKETMTRVSMDLKNRFLDKFKTTLDSVNIFGSANKTSKEAEELMEKEVNKVIQMQMQLEQQNRNKDSNDNLPSGSDSHNEAATSVPRPRTDSVSTAMSDDIVEIDFPLGKLNDSKRIDHVLQEAPLEFINEYLFALSSHVCYWDSEDTILFVMKEIYSGLGISPDSQVPQQTMTIERPSSRNSLLSSS